MRALMKFDSAKAIRAGRRVCNPLRKRSVVFVDKKKKASRMACRNS